MCLFYISQGISKLNPIYKNLAPDNYFNPCLKQLGTKFRNQKILWADATDPGTFYNVNNSMGIESLQLGYVPLEGYKYCNIGSVQAL